MLKGLISFEVKADSEDERVFKRLAAKRLPRRCSELVAILKLQCQFPSEFRLFKLRVSVNFQALDHRRNC